jgi:hypothetical protein
LILNIRNSKCDLFFFFGVMFYMHFVFEPQAFTGRVFEPQAFTGRVFVLFVDASISFESCCMYWAAVNKYIRQK